MPVWHDESYLNKYLLEYNPKIIGTKYCKPEEFDGPCKAILRSKSEILGKENVDLLKKVFVNPHMSYLYDDNLQIKSLHLVECIGRLGNQMFQYAFLRGLKAKYSDYDFRLFTSTDLLTDSIRINDLEHIFDIPDEYLVDEHLAQQVLKTSTSCYRL